MSLHAILTWMCDHEACTTLLVSVPTELGPDGELPKQWLPSDDWTSRPLEGRARHYCPAHRSTGLEAPADGAGLALARSESPLQWTAPITPEQMFERLQGAEQEINRLKTRLRKLERELAGVPSWSTLPDPSSGRG